MFPSAPPPAGSEGLLGAYGLRLSGVANAARLLVPAEPFWPRFELISELGSATGPVESVSESRAELKLRNGGEILVERQEGRVTFRTPHALKAEELVHPYLAPAAAVIGRWFGRESLHAGAFVTAAGAWALIGDRESGKSSTLAQLALAGHGVVCDDMLILEGIAALPGPRSLDLRRETAERLGAGEPLGVIGARERWRILLEPVPSPVPLCGCALLEWGERVESKRIRPSDRLPLLFEHRGLRLPPVDPVALLELASLPFWELKRPRGLDSMSAAAEHLLALAADSGG